MNLFNLLIKKTITPPKKQSESDRFLFLGSESLIMGIARRKKHKKKRKGRK